MVPRTTVVLDTNRPWVQALFTTMPERMRFLQIDTPLSLLEWASRPAGGKVDPRTRRVVVPGLRRFSALSQRLVARALRSVARETPIDVLISTDPWHAAAFEATPAALKIYYVTDPFDRYTWPRAETIALEQRTTSASDLIVSASLELADDFRARTEAPVVHLPNAVSSRFVETLQHEQSLPPQLAAVEGPIVGVVGQMNDTYDWELLGGLSRLLHDVSFVLVGPVMKRETSWQQFEELVAQPNVTWLGRQPHEMLPEFLAAFDVCLNPLRKDDWNDRRCPLRLFDYVATSVPIVSTAVREVDYFGHQVEIIDSAEQGAALIRELIDSETAPPPDRLEFAQRNTWEARATQWLALIDEHLATREVDPTA